MVKRKIDVLDDKGEQECATKQPKSVVDKNSTLMYTTNPSSAARRSWLALLKDKERKIDNKTIYISCDGSSTGWYACVLVTPQNKVLLRAAYKDMEGTRNVGAEAHGYMLGIKTLLHDYTDMQEGSQRYSNDLYAVIACDFLNALAFDCGGAQSHHPLLQRVYKEIDSMREIYNSTLSKISNGNGCDTKGGLNLIRVHHPGHQKDSSWLTHLNHIVDNLASMRRDISLAVDISMLPLLYGKLDIAQATILKELEKQ